MKKYLLVMSLLVSFKTYALEKYLCKSQRDTMIVELMLPALSHSYNESQNVCNGGVGDEPVCSVHYYVREVKVATLRALINLQEFNFQMTIDRYKWGMNPELEEKMHYSGSQTYILDKRYKFIISSSTGNGEYVLFVSDEVSSPNLFRCEMIN